MIKWKETVLSKQFLMLIALIIFIVAKFIFPNFTMDTEAAIGFLAIAVPYIIGVSFDEGAPGGWKGVLGSRRFWGAIIGLGLLIARGFGVLNLPLGLTDAQLISICVALGAWISGLSIDGFFKYTKPALDAKSAVKVTFLPASTNSETNDPATPETEYLG